MTRRDQGVAVVWALALMSILLIVGLLAAGVGVQAAVRQKAGSVADVAALAAVQSIGPPCPRARDVAAANGLPLASCRLEGADVVVEVGADPPLLVIRVMRLLGREPLPIRATARAGPP